MRLCYLNGIEVIGRMSQDYPHVPAEVHLSVYDYDEELARLQGNSDVVKLVDDVDTRALVLDPGCAPSGQVAPPFPDIAVQLLIMMGAGSIRWWGYYEVRHTGK